MAVSKWPLLIRQCLLQRKTEDEFRELVILMSEQYRGSGRNIINAILRCRELYCTADDPLIFIYIRAVLSLDILTVTNVLVSLIKHWNECMIVENIQISDTFKQDAVLIQQINLFIQSDNFSFRSGDVKTALICTAKWLQAIAEWLTKDMMRLSMITVVELFEAVAILFVNLAATDTGMKALERGQDDSKTTEPRASVLRALHSSTDIAATISMPVNERLLAIQNHFRLYETYNDATNTQELSVEAISFESNIVDDVVIPSRRGLFIYLNELCLKCSTIDDSKLLSFLNARHIGDHSAMFTNLTVASFEVYNSYVGSSSAGQKRWEHFIVNKLPAILTVISASSFGTVQPEQCLKDIFQQLEASISSTIRDKIPSLRNSFVKSCAQHRLISAEIVPEMVTDADSKFALKPLYVKEDLVAQMQSNRQRGIELLEKLVDLHEDSATVVLAISEIIHICCQRRETTFLKEIASIMVRRPEIIDVFSIFIRPALVLQPLIQVLNSWDWTNLHGESQPIYDEFGSILLLILTFKYRLNMRISDMGSFENDSFVLQFLTQGNNDLHEELSDSINEHLGSWITALFIAEGLNDELMTSCSAKDFYLIIPTLLSQSLAACEKGKLSLEVLKSGFEYLLEPFLLPSLVPAISWLCSPSAERYQTKNVAQLVTTLTKSPENAEARDVHHTILNMLQPVISGVQARGVDVKIQMQAFSIPVQTSIAEVKGWSVKNGGLVNLQPTILSLLTCQESSDSLPSVASSMRLIDTAWHILGSTVIVRAMIKELEKLIGLPDFLPAIDIFASVISSLSQETGSLNLHEALIIQYGNLSSILKNEGSTFSEALVRLQRRTALYIVVATPQDIEQVPGFVPDLTMDMNQTEVPQTEVDISLESTQNPPQDIDEMLDAAVAMGRVGEENATDNLDEMFGLNTDDMMANFDDLDMEGMF